MPSVNQSALVGYSAEQMYQLVNNYQQYPEFLPGCVASSTLTRNEKRTDRSIGDQQSGNQPAIHHS